MNVMWGEYKVTTRRFFGGLLVVSIAILLTYGCSDDSCVSDPRNHAPQILGMSIEPDSVLSYCCIGRYLPDSIGVVCIATDEDGDSLAYRWHTEVAHVIGNGSVVNVFLPPDSISVGSHCVSVEVSDGNGHSAVDSIHYTVFERYTILPIDSLVAVPDSLLGGETSTLTCYVNGVSASWLYYTWTSLIESYSFMGDSTYVLTAPMEPGDYYIRCFVTDAMGSGAYDSVLVVVKPGP
jgi:hypothetical protein